jgi:hypothetical protein
MADTWFTDIAHFLDEKGEIIAVPSQDRKLGEYFAAIIVMASYPDPEFPAGYRVICRRRPSRKPCQTELVGFIDPETDDIVWMCPKCNDRGIISNWRGTIWDMSDADETFH